MRNLLLLLFLAGLLLPSFSVTAQEECDNGNYLESRLYGGDIARVTPGGSSNRVRAEPSTDGEELFQIPPGHIFHVNYRVATVCSEGIVWKEITYLDRVGWTAESYLAVSPDYFIEPLELVQTIDETITLTNGATALAFTPDSTELLMALPDNSLTWFNLTGNSTGTATLDTDAPVLDISYHPDGSGIYATIHERSINIWNSNHNLVRTIESRMLEDYPSVFEMDDDWEFLANGGCLESDELACIDGGIIIIDPVTDEDIATLGNQHPETVRDIDFMSIPFETPGGRFYEATLASVSANTTSSANLEVGLSWQRNFFCPERGCYSDSDATLNTVTTTLRYYVVMYGGCNRYENEICVEGYLAAYGNGSPRSNFNTLPSEVLEAQFSNSYHPGMMRVVALTADETVSVIDFSHQNFDIETEIQVFNDIPAQAFAISPDGSVLAIASDDTVILYDISLEIE